MSYGLQIVGSHGVTQIDENYTNLALIATGGASFTTASAGGFGGSITLPTVATPLLAIKSSTPVYMTSDNAIPNTTYSFFAASAGSLTYYLFDQSTSTNGETWGLQVFNASGAMTYHSSWKILRIGAIGSTPSGSLSTTPGLPVTLSAPYAGSWAAVQASLRFQHTANFIGTQRFFEGLTCDNSGATVSLQSVVISGPHFANDQPNGGNILLIDVTGY